MNSLVDVAVLGGGPGGYATALRAAAHGLRVTLVEADQVGGTCLHRGCIPSKALLHVARLADEAGQARGLGLAGPGPGLDVGAAGRFRDGVVDKLYRGLEQLVRSQKIEVVAGRGRLMEAGTIRVGETTVGARHVVVATGSRVAELATLPFDGNRVLSSDDALRLIRVPRQAVVVGGGAVGVEFASLWRSLGTEVTLVEVADRLMLLEDTDSSTALARAFGKRGIDVRLGEPVDPNDPTVAKADQVLVAVGRVPATDDVGVTELGLLDERGYVTVDAFGRTAIDGVWAVGDVVATTALAHAAFAEGFVVADAIAGLDPDPVDHAQIPRVTYCNPEVASVGLTEDQARRIDPGASATVTTLAGNARSLIEGQAGQVKMVVGSDGTVLGVHLVGPSATDLIGEATLATSWGALAAELGGVTHAHPTLSEAIGETALAAAGLPFHAHRH